jgi:hypothetical protein
MQQRFESSCLLKLFWQLASIVVLISQHSSIARRLQETTRQMLCQMPGAPPHCCLQFPCHMQAQLPADVSDVGFKQAMQQRWVALDKSAGEPRVVRKVRHTAAAAAAIEPVPCAAATAGPVQQQLQDQHQLDGHTWACSSSDNQ